MTSRLAEPETGEPVPSLSRGRWAARHIRLLGLLSGVLAVVAGTVLITTRGGGSRADDNVTVPPQWRRPAVSAAGLVERSGVQITQLAVTGRGGLVDLRFRVVDPDRAAALHDAATPPALVDERSGLVVHNLLMSHSHSGPFKAGVTYYLIFENPGDWVHRGARVTVLLGDAAVRHEVVQ